MSKPDQKMEEIVARFFPEFWITYPRKAAKGQAEKAFAAKVRRGVAPAMMIDGAKRYVAERTGQDPKFTKHPATWINGDCWLDEPSVPVTIDHETGHIMVEPPPRRRSQQEIDAEAEEKILAENSSWGSRR